MYTHFESSFSLVLCLAYHHTLTDVQDSVL